METPPESNDLLLDFEAFCLRVGILGIYSGVTLVLLPILLTLYVLITHLTTILDPIGWGITLIAILVGIGLQRLFGNFLIDVLVDFVRISEKLAKMSYGTVLSDSSNFGTMVAYVTFALIGFMSYAGMYGWARRIRGLGNFSQRILVVESPTISIILLVIDLISGLVLVGAIGLVAACETRLLRAVISTDPRISATVAKILAPFGHIQRLSPEYPADPDPDTINWEFVTRYCTLISVFGIVVSGLLFGLGHLLARLPVRWIIGSVFGVGFSMSLVGNWIATDLITFLEEYVFRPPEGMAISNALALGTGGVVYMEVLPLLPMSEGRNPFIPSPIESSVDASLSVPFTSITNPVTYFELSRACSVIVLVAASIPLSFHVIRWGRDSSLSELPALLDQAVRLFTWPLRVFSAKMTSVDSRWQWWIQAAVLVQFLGIIIILQSVSAAHSVWPGVYVLFGGGTLQAGLIWRDIIGGVTTSVLSHWWWILMCCLLPPIGGVSFIIVEVESP